MLSSAAFDSINGSASADCISIWAGEEENARREPMCNITVIDIYDIKMERREFDHFTLLSIDLWLQSLLGQKCFLN